jgi:hypothetical protein
MKKYFILSICVLFTTINFAQSFIEKQFSHIHDDEKITRVQVSGKAFSMISTLAEGSSDKDAQEASKVFSKIKSFELIAMDSHPNPLEAAKLALQQASGFEELIKVKSNNTNVTLMIKERNNIVSEIVGIVAEEKKLIIFNLLGEIDMNDINKLTEKVQSSSLLQNVTKKNLQIGDVKIFPNPAKKGQKTTLTIPENLKGGSLTLFDLEGKIINTYPLTNDEIEIETDKLKNVVHVLKFQKGETTYTRKLIIME